MAFRFHTFLLRWLVLALFIGAAWLGPVRVAAAIEIQQLRMENSEDGYLLAATYVFDLNRSLEEALHRGIALYFTTDVNITRPRWYWLDENTLSASRTVRLSYNVLTRQYHVSTVGGLHQSYTTLEDALAAINRPPRWVVAEKGALKPGVSYLVAVRMHLDTTQLPKPFQINALNNSDWRLSSDWKMFTFRPE